MSQQYKYAVEIARKLKEKLPYPMAIGGVHATMVPEKVAADRLFDFIGLGECDQALPTLVRALREDKNPATIPNIWVKSDSGYNRNPLGPFPELEQLAPKDYEIFDLNQLFSNLNGWMSILTSRGCPHRCSYCFNHQLMNLYRRDAKIKPSSYLRRYPINRVINDMKMLKQKHPALRVFIFDDDLFTLNEEYVLRFCESYVESGLNLPFVVNGHVQAFNQNMAHALKDAGCMIMKFGVESGSERIRRHVLKRVMGDKAIYNAFEIAHQEGLHTSAFIMIGLPMEEREDIDATLEMIARLSPGRFRWAIFYPFPGTDIYKLCEKEGLIDRDKMNNLDNFYEASPLRFKPDLDLFIRKLQRSFHWYVNARSAFDSAPVFRQKVDELEHMSAEEWHHRSDKFLEEERRLSQEMTSASKLHYSIRFIQVMAVRSDFQEDEKDLSKPAKEWKSTPLKSL